MADVLSAKYTFYTEVPIPEHLQDIMRNLCLLSKLLEMLQCLQIKGF